MTFDEIMQKAYDLNDIEVKRIAIQTQKEYAAAYKAIDAKIKNLHLKILDGIPKGEYYNYMSKAGRYETLLKSIEVEYLQASRAAGRQTVEASKLAISNSYYRQLYSLNWTQADTVFTALNPKVIDISVFGTPKVQQELKKQTIAKIDGTFGSPAAYQPKYGNLNEILVNNRVADLAKINSTLTQSLINGDSYTKTSAALANNISSSAKQTLRIIRTESHRNQTAGNFAMTNAARSEGVKVKRQIVSTIDGRERDQSAQVDGEIEDKNGFFTYPGGVKVQFPGNSGVPGWDINDREIVIDIVDGWEPALRRGRNPATGQTELISYKDFNPWLKENGLRYNKSGRIV